MSFFDDLKSKANDVHAKLTEEAKRFLNKGFHEAVVAACAVVASSNGAISSEEKKKMMGFMELNETMKVFDKNVTIKLFNKYTEQIEFDVDLGRNEALTVVGKLSGKKSESRVVVRLVCAIGAADGDFDDDEKKEVRQICKMLDLDPAEFDL